MDAELTIGLITDLHFGPEARFGGKLRKLTAQAPELTRRFVRRMNEQVRPDLVVNLGDDLEDESLALDRERYEACAGILGELEAPLRNVAGNHDLGFLDAAELRRVWGSRHQGVAYPSSPARALYYSFGMKGYRGIVLHTQECKDVDVSIDDAQFEWLQSELAGPPTPTVVFMHHSAVDQDLRGNRWFERHPHLCLVRERARLRELFERSGCVRAVFNGHLHWNQLQVVGGIPYLTLQSLIENVQEDAPGRPAAAHAVVRLSSHVLRVEVAGAQPLCHVLALTW